MSIFKVNLTAVNPKDEDRRSQPIKVMVDTGAELSWLPKQVLKDIGILPRGKKRFFTATNQLIERDYGYAILEAGGFSTNDEIVFAEETDLYLLGVRTLEGFCVLIDSVNHKFIATESLVGSAYSFES